MRIVSALTSAGIYLTSAPSPKRLPVVWSGVERQPVASRR